MSSAYPCSSTAASIRHLQKCWMPVSPDACCNSILLPLKKYRTSEFRMSLKVDHKVGKKGKKLQIGSPKLNEMENKNVGVATYKNNAIFMEWLKSNHWKITSKVCLSFAFTLVHVHWKVLFSHVLTVCDSIYYKSYFAANKLPLGVIYFYVISLHSLLDFSVFNWQATFQTGRRHSFKFKLIIVSVFENNLLLVPLARFLLVKKAVNKMCCIVMLYNISFQCPR